MLARPYMARLRVFSLLICPSVCPLLHGSNGVANSLDVLANRPRESLHSRFQMHARRSARRPIRLPFHREEGLGTASPDAALPRTQGTPLSARRR
jgi:hypothetical protein